MTRTTPASRFTSKIFSATSSDTRSPDAYSISSIARSRRPSGARGVRRGEQRLDIGFR